MRHDDGHNPLLGASAGLLRLSGQMRKAAARCHEVAANARYQQRRSFQPMRRYEQAMRETDEWKHTDPDDIGKAPVVQVASFGGALVACTVKAVAVACPLGCCQLWEAVPVAPVDLLIMAAPGDEQNAVVTGLGAGDSVGLRLHTVPPGPA